jgi:hypothetical protein
MHTVKVAIVATACSLWAYSAGALPPVSPADAMGSVGRTATVCGLVASANYAVGSRANPTFLTVVDPERANPNRALTAVIYGTDRGKFATPEVALPGQRLCMTGHISFFRGRPEMILSTPAQLFYYAPTSVAELR